MTRPIARNPDPSGKVIVLRVAKEGCASPEGLPASREGGCKEVLALGSPLRVKALRREADVSQRELASAMGVSQPMVSKLERPGATLTQAMLAKVSAALEVIAETRGGWKAGPPQC